MLRACDQQTDDLKNVPVDAINQTVKPNSDQRRALEQLASEPAETARTPDHNLSERAFGEPRRAVQYFLPYTIGYGCFADDIAPYVRELLRLT